MGEAAPRAKASDLVLMRVVFWMMLFAVRRVIKSSVVLGFLKYKKKKTNISDNMTPTAIHDRIVFSGQLVVRKQMLVLFLFCACGYIYTEDFNTKLTHLKVIVCFFTLCYLIHFLI